MADGQTLRTNFQTEANRHVSRIDVMMNNEFDVITGVKLYNKDTCDKSFEDSKGYGDLRFLQNVPTYKMILEDGDCINSVAVGHNMIAIERLEFTTMNGKHHRMGKQSIINDDDEIEFIQFG
jgi:hypothetical protein